MLQCVVLNLRVDSFLILDIVCSNTVSKAFGSSGPFTSDRDNIFLTGHGWHQHPDHLVDDYKSVLFPSVLRGGRPGVCRIWMTHPDSREVYSIVMNLAA